MALSQMKILKAAMKNKAAHHEQRVFGTAYMQHTPRYDQTGAPMADGGMVGATVDAIRKHQAELDNAGVTPRPVSAPAPAPAAPAAPAGPVDPLTAQLEAKAKARRAAAAAAPVKKTNIFGFADGGEVTEPSTMGYKNGGMACPHGVKPGSHCAACYADGGKINGPGGPTDDKVPALLSKGEYVLPADTVEAIGKDKLDQVKAATHKPVLVAQENGMANGGQRVSFGAPLTSFERRLNHAGDPDTGAATIMTPANTKGAKAPLFGARLANGGSVANPTFRGHVNVMPGFTVSLADGGLPDIDPNVQQPLPEIDRGVMQTNRAISAQPRVDLNAAKPSAALPQRQVFGKAPPNAGMLAERAAAAPVAVQPAVQPAATASRSLFGRAAGAIGDGASKVASVAARTYGTARGLLGVATSAPVAGAALALHSEDAGAGSDVIRNADGSVANKTMGSELSPEFSAMDSSAQAGLIAERNDPKTDPARVAQIDETIRGRNPVPAVVDPSAKYGAPGTSNAAQSAPSQDDAQGQPGQPALSEDARRALVQNPGDTEVHALGDYGVPGTQIFGRASTQGGKIDDFVGTGGVGGPHQGATGTGTPADIAAQRTLAGYRATLDNDAAQRKYEDSVPRFYSSPETEKARAAVASLQQKFAGMRPGQEGHRATARMLAAQQGALSALEGTDRERNAFAQNQFGRTQELAMHRMSLGNQAIGYGVQAQGNQLTFDAKMAEVGNASHKQIVDEAQQRLGNSKDRLTNLAKADGGDPELYQIAGATRQFPGTDGKMHLYQDLDEGARAKADGFIQNQAAKMKARKDAGLPYSISDSDKNEGTGVLGWARSMIKAPVDSIRFGTTQTGSFTTARPNKPVTHEASAADAAQRKARQ